MKTRVKIKIETINLKKVFRDSSGHGEVVAIDNLSLKIRENEFFVVIGPSGCGKSTFLYLIAGFEKPTTGQILLGEKNIDRPGPDRGIVFQEFALYPWRTVLGNVMFGLEIQKMPKRIAREKAMYYIKMVGLDRFRDAYPHTLSGGMKQRVGIARSLAYGPEVLLMDEPLGSLDAQTRKIMQQELIQIWQREKKTVIFVTHSVIEAVFLADRIIVMTARPGKIKGIIDVGLPRPRDYTSPEYLAVRKQVLDLLEEEVVRSMEESRGLNL